MPGTGFVAGIFIYLESYARGTNNGLCKRENSQESKHLF
jgi:hypothetical protein